MRGIIRTSKAAVVEDNLMLKHENGLDGEDPLAGLCRMGLLDLVNHCIHEDVLIVITKEKNSKFVKRFGGYGEVMVRRNIGTKYYLVVKKAKVSKINVYFLSLCWSFWGRLWCWCKRNVSSRRACTCCQNLPVRVLETHKNACIVCMTIKCWSQRC